MLDLVCIFYLLFKGCGEMGRKRAKKTAQNEKTDGMKYALDGRYKKETFVLLFDLGVFVVERRV